MDKFSRLLALQRAKRPAGTFATTVNDDINEAADALARTDVAREMKDCTNTDMDKSLALPNPSENNKTKLRKVRMFALMLLSQPNVEQPKLMRKAT